MNVLVTGGSGFIGSYIVDRLIDAGNSVRVLDVKEPYRNDVEFLKGNITNRSDLETALKNIEIVYHIAGFSNIDKVKDNPVETVESNILATTYLLEESRKANIKRFIFASSVYVHSREGHLYTTSKLASELLCENYQRLYSLPYTILRFGTAYGPRSREADVVSIFAEKALNGEKIVIHGSGSQRRNFIYVEDIAKACIAALKDIAINKTYVIAGMRSVSIKELAEAIRDTINKEVIVETDNSKAREDDYAGKLDGLKETMIDLDWKPETDMVEGIKRYAEWFKTK